MQFGVHLCYGDVAKKHFAEPDDAAYFAPLANLALHPETELFLG